MLMNRFEQKGYRRHQSKTQKEVGLMDRKQLLTSKLKKEGNGNGI